MKTIRTILITVALVALATVAFAQSVGINSDGSAPDGSAMLDVSSTTKGFLPPRMSTAQIGDIASPPEGLTVYNSDLHALVFYNGTTWVRTDGQFTMGQSYGGGIIFYLDPTGHHGLIAATVDAGPAIIWAVTSYQTTSVPEGTGTAIWTGSTNTDRIISQNGTVPWTFSSYAASLARSYNGGGYSDWFLPSKDELAQMFTHKTDIGNFADNSYWSSSEYDYQVAWIQYFDNGYQTIGQKLGQHFVRAIRAF
ncbi:MAG: DUF1566 domain-containing protein [Bacteroidota bacterium]